MPRDASLQKIAEYFFVTVDELIGRKDEVPDLDAFNNADTAKRIFELLDSVGMEQKKFAALVGVSPQKVSEWKNGKAKSYTKRIPLIAEVLNTTSEYLLTGNGPKTRTDHILPFSSMDSKAVEDLIVICQRDHWLFDLLALITALSPNAQKEVEAFINFKLVQEGKTPESILEPDCGSGGSLMQALHVIQKNGSASQDAEADIPLVAHGGPSGKISAKTAEALEKGAVESSGDI